MDRRAFLGTLAGGLLAGPLATEAQPAGKVYRIGLIPGGPLAVRMHQWDAFRQTLRDLGYVEGRNILLEFRPPGREGDRFDDLAANLVHLRVDVIVASGSSAIRAAKRLTSTIPIVMCPAANPVEEGLVASLARPGGNVTGLSVVAMDLSGKRLETLREMVPRLSRVAVLRHSRASAWLPSVEASGRVMRIQLLDLPVIQAGELEKGFEAAVQWRADAMMVMASPLFFGLRTRIADLAVKHRLPAVYDLPSFAHAGGLVVYGPSDTEYYRRAAHYVDRILKGAKPADLPVEQPTKIELIINMKAARALGLTIPQSLLQRADQVIE